MRTLDFVVDEQVLTKDSSCDFSNIVSGTKGYLEARFKFSRLWDGFGKVAVFVNLLEEYPAVIKNGRCVIPDEALTGSKFSVYVVGKRGENKLTSTSVEVQQERSNTWLK